MTSVVDSIPPVPDNVVQDVEDNSQLDRLILFVQARCALFHDVNKNGYVKLHQTGEVLKLDSRQFKDWISAEYHCVNNKAVRENTLREMISTLSGIARFKREERQVNVRVAKFRDDYYLDLCQPGNSKAVRITSSCWEIIDDPPVEFWRGENMQPLPDPIDGDMADLWRVTNIPDKSRLLVVTILIDWLRPDTPYPVLELLGEEGSGKSSSQEALRQIIDPNVCNLRAAPKTTEDIFVTAGVNHLVSYENISYLAPQTQDALCTLSTGGGFAKRKLYTDADESVLQVQRPVCINGISASVTAQDLVSRTITVECLAFESRQRIPDLLQALEAAKPGILGELLSLFSKALFFLPQIEVPAHQQSRLIEFVQLGIGIAKAQDLPRETFLNQYNASRRDSISRTIEASPVASAILSYVEEMMTDDKETKTAKQWLGTLTKFKSDSDGWPKTPKGMGDSLRRAASALRVMGVEVVSEGRVGGVYHWTICKESSGLSPARPQVTTAHEQSPTHEDLRTCRTSNPKYPCSYKEEVF